MTLAGIGLRMTRLDGAVAARMNAAARQHRRGRAATAILAERLAAVEVALMAGLMVGRRPTRVAHMLAAVGLVYAASEIVGAVWPRQRPFVQLAARIEPLVWHAGGRSFPSRHVASGLAMAAIGHAAQPTLGGAMAAVALLLGLSRIGAGLHYPSDVAAGALLGAAVGRLLRR